MWDNWIIERLTTTTFTMLMNGKPWIPFVSERGIGQCDPISSYNFTIFAEYLSSYIHFMTTQKNSGIRIKSTKDCLIYLTLFADECLIFCKTRKQATKKGTHILEHYSKVSRLLINYK